MSGSLSPTPVMKFFDNNGNPLAQGLLTTYAAGTTTPLATYTDSTLGTANPTTITLNFRGEAAVWLPFNVAYKFLLTDSAGNTIPGYPVDQIVNPETSLTQAEIGELLYPQVVQESNVSVTPTNYQYPPGNVKRYGAVGNGAVNDTAAIAQGLSVGWAGGLGFLYFPAATGGGYVSTGNSVTITNAAGEISTNKGLHIYGDTPNNCQIVQSGTPAQLLLVTSGSSSTLTEAELLIENIAFQGAGSAGSNTNGVALTSLAVWQLRNVYSCGFNTGITFVGSLIGGIKNCLISNNLTGMNASSNAASPANLLAIEDSRFIANAACAAQLLSGSNIKFRKVDFEENGTSGQSGTFAVIIQGTIGAGFGASVISFDNCWFEANVGGYALGVAAGTQQLSLAIRDSLFLDNGPSGSGQDINVQSAQQLTIDNVYASTAAGSTTIIASGVINSRIVSSAFTTLTDTSINPWYENVIANGVTMTNGRYSTFQATVNGLASSLTGTVGVYQQGGEITFNIPSMVGTASGSNTGLNFTGIPTALQPAATVGGPVGCEDTGLGNVFYGNIVGSTNELSINGHVFATTGNKGFLPCLFKYRIAN